MQYFFFFVSYVVNIFVFVGSVASYEIWLDDVNRKKKKQKHKKNIKKS